MERDELLLAITRCPEVGNARANAEHPCAGIVGLQPPDRFQAPEPWRGHIDTAPILFLSSNPTIPVRISPETYNRVRFWTGVRSRATEILGRPAIPGKDFALTYLVHCKSTGERGVTQALPRCAERWLELVMRASGADIIVLVGKQAGDHCAARWGLDKTQPIHFDVDTPGRKRTVIILPHPDARGRHKAGDLDTPGGGA